MHTIDMDEDNDRHDIIYQGNDGRLRIEGRVKPTNESNDSGFFSSLHDGEKDGEL